MKIPLGVLEQVRGPLLAVAVFGCATPAVEESPPVAAPRPIVAAQTPDPVAYDAIAEAERLTRTDGVLSATESRKSARIEESDAAIARRGGYGHGGAALDRQTIIMLEALCGRG